MTIAQLIFYFFAAIAIGSAILVITLPSPVHSVLSLIVTFFAVACIWMSLQAELLALMLLLVYAGAVMTLFLFVVMMLNMPKLSAQPGKPYWSVIIGMIAFTTTGLLITLLLKSSFHPPHALAPIPSSHQSASLSQIAAPNSIAQLGITLFSDYAYPTEIAGVILLLAMFAAIALVHRPPIKRKIQSPDQQVATDPRKRLRLIKG